MTARGQVKWRQPEQRGEDCWSLRKDRGLAQGDWRVEITVEALGRCDSSRQGGRGTEPLRKTDRRVRGMGRPEALTHSRRERAITCGMSDRDLTSQ